MSDTGLGPQTIEQVSRRLKEPAWLSQLRTAAWQRHAELPWPHPSDEIWRRTDVSMFDPGRPAAVPIEPLLASVSLRDAQVSQLIHPVAAESLLVRADGTWVTQNPPPGVVVSDLATAARTHVDVVQPLLESDGLTPQEQKFTSLNTAFHHDGVFLRIPAGFAGAEPIRLVRLLSVSPQAALFPLTVIVVGEGSSVSLIHEDAGVGPASAGSAHTINGRIELVLEPNAAVRYCRIQRWDAGAHEFLLQRATLQEGAQLDMVNINIGGRVVKSHVIAKLLGPQASSRAYGFVFGHHEQHVDFHSLQDHQAPRTFSDLLYKAALKDASRLIYTGLIRIAKAAKQTDAYQANHNLLLSQQAKAETIPMLEILADDVRCKHGATIGPVDEEQLFYFMTRGIPRAAAERLLVMGFVEPIIQQVPGEAFQQRLREELGGSLQPVSA